MDEMTRDEAVRKIGSLIGQVPVAMLTTTSPRGWLRSRPMVTQHAPFDGTLWFFTSRTAAKAGDVRDRRQVNVSYASPEHDCYVSVAGIATIVEDEDKACELWNPAYEPWLPGGLNDPDVVLIRVEAQEAEYWDSAAKKMVVVSELMQPRPVFRDMAPGLSE